MCMIMTELVENSMIKLPSNTARLISSGQVVTSVSNAVKELVENALDAKGTVIEIRLEKGGLDKLEVRDNGVGIKASEVSLAAQRHYTSKIQSHNDLQSLTSYGFRGEALNSLCEVSDVVITTRTKDELYSTVYTLDAKGNVKSKKPSHIAQGTTVTVTKLFKNLPVRKQYFGSTKKIKEQIKQTEDLLMAFAVAQPSVEFKLMHDRCCIWQTHHSATAKSAFLHNLLLPRMELHEMNVECIDSKIQIQLYFPKHYKKRKTNDRFFLIINKRPVRNKDIEKLVRHLITKMSDPNEQIEGWPAALVIINVPLSTIDVNVNANKTEIILTLKEKVIKLIEDMFETVASNKDYTNTACVSTDKRSSDILCNNIVDMNTKPHDVFTDAESVSNSKHETNSALKGSAMQTESVDKEKMKDMALHTEASSVVESVVGASRVSSVPEKKNLPVNYKATDIADEKHVGPVASGLASKNWSSGNCVTDSMGNIVDPVKVIRPLNSVPSLKRPNSTAYKQTTLDENVVLSVAKKPRSIFDLSKDVTKKSWNELNKEDQKKVVDLACAEYDQITKEKSKAKQRKSFVVLNKHNESDEELDDPPEIGLLLSFQTVSNRVDHLKFKNVASDSVTVVGYFNEHTAAVVFLNETLYVVNLHRLQETLIFQKLSQTFKLPTVDLDTHIVLTENNIGPNAVSCLNSLIFSATSALQPESECLDKRLFYNGFKIKRVADSLQLRGLATSIPCYGLNDLSEILLKIYKNDKINLQESRSSNSLHYLQGEASRIALTSPALSGKDELVDALNFLKQDKTWPDILSSTCFHAKNIFFELNAASINT